MEAIIGSASISLVCGDLTDQETDAIVNSANPSLLGGGGVDGAIHGKGGGEIVNECRKIRKVSYPDGLPTGKVVITIGGKLKAKKVIHAIGPIWRGGKNKEPELLAEAYMNSLDLALRTGLKTISFPSISTGAYGYPVGKAARIAIRAIAGFLKKNQGIEEVRLVLHNIRDLSVYEEALSEVLSNMNNV